MRDDHSPLNPLPELEHLPAPQRRRLYRDAQRDLTLKFWIVYITLILVGIAAIQVLLVEPFYTSRFNPGLPKWLCVGIGGGAGGGLMVLAQVWIDRRYIRRAIWRRLPHLCPACGYNLTGNTSGVCPECGREIGPESGRKVE